MKGKERILVRDRKTRLGERKTLTSHGVLSLDGGGMRGVVTWLMLEHSPSGKPSWPAAQLPSSLIFISGSTHIDGAMVTYNPTQLALLESMPKWQISGPGVGITLLCNNPCRK